LLFLSEKSRAVIISYHVKIIVSCPYVFLLSACVQVTYPHTLCKFELIKGLFTRNMVFVSHHFARHCLTMLGLILIGLDAVIWHSAT
jgi:hypothetical protein